MKKISTLILVFLGIFSINGFAQPDENMSNKDVDGSIIEVYYFHLTRRCATCQAVEDESKAALENLYPQELESGKVVFMSVDLEEEENDQLAEKLQVAGQSLLVVKGDEQVDLTAEGFKYARSSPEKLQEKLKDAIDPLL